jgi:DNA repair exonuclease SbcCD ATPase subunit
VAAPFHLTEEIEMKVKSIKIQNVKNLQAEEFEVPAEAPCIYVTGPNGAGKSALLDSILYALAGKKKIPAGAIRNGAATALIQVETDEGLKIERKITANGAYLKIYREDGSEAPRPQEMLDRVMGPISMEPWAFIAGTAKARRDLILKSAGVEDDLATIEEEDRDAREERRLAKRALKETEAKLKGAPMIDPSIPEEPVDVRKLREELRDLRAGMEDWNRAQSRIQEIERRTEEIEEEIKMLREKSDLLQEERGRIEKWAEGEVDTASEVEVLEAKIEEADATNRRVSEVAETRYLLETKRKQADRVDLLEERVAKVEKKRVALMGRIAEALPVEGLEVGEDDVMVDGVGFSNLSTAQRLKVAVALATKEDPELRVVRITDGSVLDKSSRAFLDQIAREEGLQIWIEDVRESGALKLEISAEE